MSSPFNYEIDEKNLRSKLRDMSIPYKEEAWKQFEAYNETLKHNHKSRALPDFQLNINRNVILPVVFGVIIILFSMVLFNFVSFKKPVEPAVQNPPPDPQLQPEVATLNTSAIKDSAVVKSDSLVNDSLLIKQDSMITAPTVTTVAVAVPEPTVNNVVPENSWTSTETLDIYEHPNIKSNVIGSAARNKTYNALEETNYFIKITFEKNGKMQEGFARKQFLIKGSEKEPAINSSKSQENNTKKKSKRKAEVLESRPATSLLPTGSEEKEPELR